MQNHNTEIKKLKKKKTQDIVSSMVEHPSAGERVADVFIILFCALVAFCSVIPMWHVLMSSLSDGKTLLTHEGMVWLPVGKITMDGYAHIFADSDIIRSFVLAAIYTVASTALGFFVSVTGGYAMSRQTKLKKPMIIFVMITMLFGGGMVPTYLVVKSLGLVGSPLAIIVPGCTNAMFIVMMMNAFNQIDPAMYEAARIDGAGHFRTLFIIMMPLAMNMGAVIILNSIVGQWNSWIPASIYLPNVRELWPLQLIIRELTSNAENFLQSTNPDYSRYLIQYGVVIVSCLPIILLFPFFQNKMERAVIAGGVKG